MSKQYTFKLNLNGLRELMKSGDMQNILNSASSEIANKCGEDWEVESAHPLSYTAITSVRATTIKARRSNNKHNTLEKAVRSTKV